MKRAFDLTCASIGLAALAPLLILIAAAVWLEDRKWPLFSGKRVGRGGGCFGQLKFRTMIPDAWKSGVSSTAADDPRITRVGRWLRKTKLDELPQLWNVVRGEMSLVGPRPQVGSEVALYTWEETRMLAVRPGLTDLASIVFADEAEILAGACDPDLLYNQVIRPWKSRLALASLEHGSLELDIETLALTLLAAVWRKEALRRVAHTLRSWGAEEDLVALSRRREPLRAWSPPGAGGQSPDRTGGGSFTNSVPFVDFPS